MRHDDTSSGLGQRNSDHTRSAPLILDPQA